jgi:16S rRNA (guanine(1405)-N(7))-methyltransferase
MNEPGDIELLLARLTTEIQASRKYRGLALPAETLRGLLQQELVKGRTGSAALQAVREKLHNIVAPYLGDPDYPAAAIMLEQAVCNGDSDSVKAACQNIMAAHASTKERIPWLDTFYPQLWSITGTPGSVLDLACGLHPFGLPWMGLPQETQYHAFDLHTPRIESINHFLRLLGHEPLAVVQDILVNPPQLQADVALFFKEAHRFEQRQRGCNRPFFEALNVRWLLVSLPAADLSGHHSLVDRQRNLMDSILAGLDWPVQELLIGNELVFCIRKT